MMKKNKSFGSLIVCILFFSQLWLSSEMVAQVLMPSKGKNTKTMLLNGTWKFKYIPSTTIGADSLFYKSDFDVTKWAHIKVPGNWELQGFAEPKYGKELEEGSGLYRTTFTAPASWKGSPVYIAFDGVQYGYSLWVNGNYVGDFASSYNRQSFNISSFVQLGSTNTLAVKVSTRVKGYEFDTNDDWSLSGIIRDVTLFALPAVHINDVVVQTILGTNKATIDIKTVVEKTLKKEFSEKLNVFARLLDPQGKEVKDLVITNNPTTSALDNVSFHQQAVINNPYLWTAETPHLYTLILSLKDDNSVIQQYSQKIGIREVSWANGILKLNNSPIKLRGVNHHDLSPINGRAITEAELLEDLKLIRKANINFIRTSHYPPQPRLLQLCDSLGFYLMVEVPFGYGDEHLKDKSYLPILQERAKSTIRRDKNHASVIAWSIGNENPVTEITLQTANYVKTLDNSRPVCFPQKGSDFPGFAKKYPDSLDIYAPHYPNVNRLKEYSDKFDHPIILTEYAHSLGLDFDLLDSLFEIISSSPKLAGGAIWMFQDQGILRKAKEKVSKSDLTKFAWKDETTFYDTNGEAGTDGIVYANRIPQVDYWQVRKVYTPVKALDDTLTYQAGKKNFAIKLINRYDFTDLSAVKCKWELYADTKKIDSGITSLKGIPHDTVSVVINTNLAIKPVTTYYYLKLFFTNKENYQFYEKTYPIRIESSIPDLKTQFVSKGKKPVLKGSSVLQDNYLFELAKATGQVQLKNKKGKLILSEGPFVRVGRKTTLAKQYFTKKNKEENQRFLLSNLKTEVISSNAQQLIVNYSSEADSSKTNAAGKVAYQFSDNGSIAVNYHFSLDGKANLPEAGLSFIIPASLTEFRWVGKGPYQAYPGKDKLSEFGFYHLNSEDIYYSGNRQEVDCALFTDSKGNGFALLSNKANISVERTEKGIVVSHNALVSGRFNKFGWPDLLHTIEKTKEIDGSFTIIPLTGKWPESLQKIFGKPDQTVVPFKPFYHSYDQ